MPRYINAAGLNLIKRFEGCSLTPYKDVAGIWTVGYGHAPASPVLSITPEQAEGYLRQDLHWACSVVSDATQRVSTTENEYAAMVSLCFNIGAGAYLHSTVLARHLAGKGREAARAFCLWDKAHVDGQLQVVPGLLHRRQAEAELYLTV